MENKLLTICEKAALQATEIPKEILIEASNILNEGFLKPPTDDLKAQEMTSVLRGHMLPARSLKSMMKCADFLNEWLNKNSNPEWSCKKCGSTDIQIKTWIVANTGQSKDEKIQDSDTWCEVCQDHTGVNVV